MREAERQRALGGKGLEGARSTPLRRIVDRDNLDVGDVGAARCARREEIRPGAGRSE